MDDRVILPPSSLTVEHDHRARLYQADGKALIRSAGFVPHGARMATQTTGTFPQLTARPKPSKRPTKKGGKRSC